MPYMLTSAGRGRRAGRTSGARSGSSASPPKITQRSAARPVRPGVGLHQLAEGRGGLVEHGDPLRGQQRVELLRGAADRSRAPPPAGRRSSSAPQISHTEKSNDVRVEQRPDVVRRRPVPVSVAAQQPGDVAVRDDDALGPAGGPRRVDHVGRAVLRHRHPGTGRLRRAGLSVRRRWRPGRDRAVRVDLHHPPPTRRQPTPHTRTTQHHRHTRIRQHPRQPLHRIIHIQRHIRRTHLQHPQTPHHRIHRPPHTHPHQPTTTHTPTPQQPRHPIRQHPQLPIRQHHLPTHHRHRTRRHTNPPPHQLMHQPPGTRVRPGRVSRCRVRPRHRVRRRRVHCRRGRRGGRGRRCRRVRGGRPGAPRRPPGGDRQRFAQVVAVRGGHHVPEGGHEPVAQQADLLGPDRVGVEVHRQQHPVGDRVTDDADVEREVRRLGADGREAADLAVEDLGAPVGQHLGHHVEVVVDEVDVDRPVHAEPALHLGHREAAVRQHVPLGGEDLGDQVGPPAVGQRQPERQRVEEQPPHVVAAALLRATVGGHPDQDVRRTGGIADGTQAGRDEEGLQRGAAPVGQLPQRRAQLRAEHRLHRAVPLTGVGGVPPLADEACLGGQLRQGPVGPAQQPGVRWVGQPLPPELLGVRGGEGGAFQHDEVAVLRGQWRVVRLHTVA